MFSVQRQIKAYILLLIILMYLLDSELQNHRMVEFVRDCWRLSCLAKVEFIISNLNLPSRKAIEQQITWP